MRQQPDARSPRSPSHATSAVIDDGGHSRDASPRLDQQTVLNAYARWAPIYDFVFARLVFFGAFFDVGRRVAIDHINTRQGNVLEVGIGTGVALNRYAPHLAIFGIDLSPDMLAVARRRTLKEHLSHVRELREMDAMHLAYLDNAFDTVAIMYVITVVPNPLAVLDEVARVLKPGGEAVIVSHFASLKGWRAPLERFLIPLTKYLGWRPDLPVSRILQHPELEHIETRRLSPLGIFSIVRLRKTAP